jgi:hypothetical protein
MTEETGSISREDVGKTSKAREAGKMAGIGVSTEVAEPLDIHIRLVSGAMATLRIPVPMTEQDYDHLKKVVELNLEIQKAAWTAGWRGRGEDENAEKETEKE